MVSHEELNKIAIKYQAEQRIEEIAWFYKKAQDTNPSIIVEIGIKEGGNLKVLSTLLSEEGLAVGIDQREEIPWKMDDSLCKVEHIVGSSHEPYTLDRLKELLGGRPIDVLFIDGDHSCEGMLQDYKDYAPLVKDGGIIAVHDIYYLEEVTAAWNAIEHPRKEESPKIHSSIGIGVITK